MNLLVAYKNTKLLPGFTLIEIMLVMALMFVVGVFVSPVGVSFYKTQLLNDTSDGLISSLRQAQSLALSGKNGNTFGVYIGESSYVLFEGSSYESRLVSEDLVFPISESVIIVGPTEIVFSELSGDPSTVGTITLTSETKERQINILPSGNIDR